jgi:hypothetical protein
MPFFNPKLTTLIFFYSTKAASPLGSLLPIFSRKMKSHAGASLLTGKESKVSMVLASPRALFNMTAYVATAPNFVLRRRRAAEVCFVCLVSATCSIFDANVVIPLEFALYGIATTRFAEGIDVHHPYLNCLRKHSPICDALGYNKDAIINNNDGTSFILPFNSNNYSSVHGYFICIIIEGVVLFTLTIIVFYYTFINRIYIMRSCRSSFRNIFKYLNILYDDVATYNKEKFY